MKVQTSPFLALFDTWIGHSTAIAMARPSAMEGRVRMILDASRTKGVVSLRWGIAVVSTAIAMIAPIAALHAQSHPVSAASTQSTEALVHYSGHVLSPDGKPVAGAEVAMRKFGNRGDEQFSLAQSGADGSFSLLGPPQSERIRTLRIQAWKAGLGPAAVIAVDGKDHVLPLARPTSIRLIFLDPSNVPVPNLKVRLFRADRNMAVNGVFLPLGASDFAGPHVGLTMCLFSQLDEKVTATTNAYGECTLDNLPQDAHVKFEVDDDHYAPIAKEPFVHTGTDRQSPPITFHLKTAGAISGKVFYASTGAPAVGIPVVAKSEKGSVSSGWGADVLTNQSGEYRISRLPEDNYSVGIESRDVADWTAIARGNIHVPAGRTARNEDLELIKGGVIHIRIVKSDTGGLVTDGSIAVKSYDPDLYFDRILHDAGGQFTLRVPPGSYNARFSGPAPDGYFGEREGGARRWASEDFRVSEGQDLSVDLRLTINPGKPVAGHVVDADGKPMAGILVRAAVLLTEEERSIDGSFYRRTDANGGFAFDTLRPGTNLTAVAGRAGTLQPIQVNGGEQNLQIKLARNARTALSGTIVDKAGQPLANCGIYLTIFNEYEGIGSRIPNAETDAVGHFTLPNLYPVVRNKMRVHFGKVESIPIELKFTPGAEHFDVGKIVFEPSPENEH